MLQKGELLIPVAREAAPLNLYFAPQHEALNRFTAANLAAQMTPNPPVLDLDS
jgi:hypothetical protein